MLYEPSRPIDASQRVVCPHCKGSCIKGTRNQGRSNTSHRRLGEFPVNNECRRGGVKVTRAPRLICLSRKRRIAATAPDNQRSACLFHS